MQFAGVVPEDAPDPRLDRLAKLDAMPVPIYGLVAQPAIDDRDEPAITSGSGGSGTWMMAVSLTYLLWRNPADRSDPANLADLDDDTRRSLDAVPPWPRPAWLLEAVERMRYPTLWEAVRTTWHRDPAQHPPLADLLADHTRHVLMNRFREEHGLDLHGWDSPALPSERSVRPGVPVVVDGGEQTGAELDTDPFVYAVGAVLPSGGTLTAVVPRDDLTLLTLAFERRPRTRT